MIDGRSTERWRHTFFTAPTMTYSEALLWIVLRDADAMAEIMDGPRDWNRDHDATFFEGWIAVVCEADRANSWLTAQPVERLHDALRVGQVVALGRRLVPAGTSSGREAVFIADEDHETIPASAWASYRIGQAANVVRETVAAIRMNHIHGLPTRSGWGDLYFESAGIFATFPGKAPVAVFPARAANESAEAPPIIEFAEKAKTLARAVAAIRGRGEEPSKGKLARECANLYREEWGQGKARATTAEGVGASIKAQWSSGAHARSLDWLLDRASRG